MTPEEIAAAEAEAIRLAEAAKAAELSDEDRTAAELAAAKKQTEVDKAKQDAAAAEEALRNRPTDEQAESLKEIMKWKKKAREAEERVKLFEGIDPAKARTALEAQQAAERKEMEARGEYDRILAQVNEQHEAVLASVQAERDSLLAKIDDLTNSGKKKDVANKFANSTFVRETLTISGGKVQTLFGGHFEYNAEGDLVGYDKPAGEAARTPLVDAQGKPLAFEAALEKIVKADPDYTNMAKSNLRRGPGSTTNNLNHNPPAILNTSQDKIKAGLANLRKNGLNIRG